MATLQCDPTEFFQSKSVFVEKTKVPRYNESFGVTIQSNITDTNGKQPYSCLVRAVKNDAKELMEGTLHPGDIILSVNGTDVKGWPLEDVVGAVQDTPHSESLVLEVCRAKSIDDSDDCATNIDVDCPSKQDMTVNKMRLRHTEKNASLNTDAECSNATHDENGNVETNQYQLTKDIFSLLFISNIKSQAFLYSFLCFLFQITVIILIIYDLLSDAPEGNELKIPPGASEAVITAQFLALIITVLTQDDVVTALEMADHGYHKGIMESCPSATYIKFIFANFARFGEGILTIVVSFLFIVTSTSVLDIFKDFAAVAFISNLDNLAFQLAKRGFITKSVQKDAKKVETATLSEGNTTTKSQCKLLIWNTPFHRLKIRNILFGITSVIICLPWVAIRAKQHLGYYKSLSCKSLTVKFGDETLALADGGTTLHYAYFSNNYKIEEKNKRFELEGNRPVYYERGQKEWVGKRAPGKFLYCKDLQAWAFTIEDVWPRGNSSSTWKACENWLLRSPETEVYALEEVPLQGWSIWTGITDTAQDFSLSCDECSSNIDCSLHGQCVESTCVCDKKWLGQRCDSKIPCNELLYTNNRCSDYKELPGFVLLRDENNKTMEVYGRPVFAKLDTSSLDYNFDQDYYYLDDDFSWNEYVFDNNEANVVFYTGRRWYDGYFPAHNISVLRGIFNETFHAHWDSVLEDNTQWFSEQTDSSTPIGLEWYELSETRSGGDYGPFGRVKKVAASYHCKRVDCEKSNVCGENGGCDKTENACNCDVGTFGHFCQFTSDDDYSC